MREIELSDQTRFPVYDTSGPYTDPDLEIDPYAGIHCPRESWIEEREDTEKLTNFTSRFTRKQERNQRLEGVRFPLTRLPRRARPGGNVSQMHYARKGIVTPEMEFVALRENLAQQREQETVSRHSGEARGGPNSGKDHTGVRAQRGRAGKGNHPLQYQSSRSRAHGHRA